MADEEVNWRARAEAAEAELSVVREQVASLSKQVAELLSRLDRDSTNSHKPPSSDPPGRKTRRAERRKKKSSGRKAGGQPGHKGHHRKLMAVEDVDRVVTVRAEVCRCCGESLDGIEACGRPMRYQQAELPPVRPVVTEFRAEAVQCPCGERNPAPLRANQRWCTGPRLMAVIATLAGRYRLARDETTSLLRDLLGVELSEGTVQAICERTSDAVAGPVGELEAQLASASQLFMDETGWKQAGVRYWLWAASTAELAVFQIHRRRSSAQVRAWLPDGTVGILTSDRWGAYGHLAAERRQLCWAHLFRDLQGLVDADPNDLPTAAMLAGAKQMFRHWRAFQDGELERLGLQAAVAGFRADLKQWASKAAASKTKGKRRGLARDLIRMWTAVFQFIDRDGIEPTNNQAERDLRPAVLWRKGSFGTRSDAGSRFVARILSVWATCKRQKRSLIDWLTQAIRAAAGLEQVPTLLPT